MDTAGTYCLCGQTYNPDQFMVQCDHCKEWYHGSCVNVREYQAIEIDKYHCPRCTPICGPSQLKMYTNWHRYDFWDPDPSGKPVQTGTGVFIKELLTRHFASEGEIIIHMRGQQLTESYLHQNGFNSPIVIDGKDGLDMHLPPDNFSLYDVESYVGGEREIDVIDVMRQCDFKMSLRDFVEYFNNPSRTRIFNVVSLEFSKTSLSRLIEAPLVARKLDWVNTVWPKDIPDDTFVKPHVQKYCLMSVKDSYTDFHIDFGGTSVWYHIFKGEKVFYFIRPTPANLTLYQQWMTSSTQSETFFGDQVDQCFKCTLRQGQTMLIPTGWIHAVLTPVDSLVFGGNFLHSLNIPMQLQIYDIEKKIKTAEKFKFPYFETINWYAAKKVMGQLRELNADEKKCPSNFLLGVKSLLAVLKQWNTDKDYNMSNREQIPDVINSHKLLKDLGKEIRHAERFLNSLNPPKPERESKRKRKKLFNKDFVDYSSLPKVSDHKDIDIESLSDTELNANFKTIESYQSQNNVKNVKNSLSKSALYVYNKFPSSSLNNKSFNSSNMLPPLSQDTSTDLYLSQGSTESGASSGKSWPDYPDDQNERWFIKNVTTNSCDGPGAILKFVLGSKDNQASVSNQQNQELNSFFPNNENESKTIYDFHDDEQDDEYALKIDENPKRKRSSKVRDNKYKTGLNDERYLLPTLDNDPDTPKNGIESLLKASAMTNKFVSTTGGASPSTREAIAGMLSIGETYNMPYNSLSKQRAARNRRISTSSEIDESIDKVHQDDDYIYPSLDNSDEDDCQIFKTRGRSKIDEAWSPKARVGPLLPKMNRPAREGTKKKAVEKVLEAAAAKRATETTPETPQKRIYKKKKIKMPKLTKTVPSPQGNTISGSSFPCTPNPSTTTTTTTFTRNKKGMKTVKQRLGKILKIHRMMH